MTEETDRHFDPTIDSQVDAMISEGGPVFDHQINDDTIDGKRTIDQQVRDRNFFRRQVERNRRRGQSEPSVRRAIDPREHSTGD